jgi:primosomal protein DnaI
VAQKEKAEQDRITARVDATGISQVHRRNPFTNWTANGSNSGLNAAKEWLCKAKENVTNGIGLTLIGPPGTGKSWVLSWLIAEVASSGTPAKIVHYREWSELLRTVKDGDPMLRDMSEWMAKIPLLLIDDLARVEVPEWRLAFVTSVIDRRWSSKRATLISANTSRQVLEDRIGADSVSRLIGNGKIVVVDGKDMRTDSR